MIIRQFQDNDIMMTKQIVKEAFYRDDKHVLYNEWEFVSQVLIDDGFVEELCFVVEEYHTIVAYLIFTQARIGESKGLTLGPVAVKPNYQGREIASHLIQHGLDLAGKLGYEWVALTGGDYYNRFGFTQVKDNRIILDINHPENAYIKIKPLNKSTLLPKGKLVFASSFYNDKGQLL